MKKRIVYGIILLFIVLIGWRLTAGLLKQSDSDAGRRQRAVPVQVAPVERRLMIDSGSFTGSLLPNSKFTVAPKVAGKLEKLLVNLGDTVQNGSLIATLDDDEYEQQLVQARADLDVSRANLIDAGNSRDAASREFERVKTLREQKIASATELDQAESAFVAAQAGYEVALVQIRHKEAAVRAAEVRMAYTQIHAIWEKGQSPRVIAERYVDEGTMLRANDPIVSVVDLDRVLGVIHVVEKDFPKILIGQSAVLTTDAHPGKSFEGCVVRKSPILDEATRQARVEIEIPNPDGLLTAGMFIRAELQFKHHDEAMVVPNSAVVTRNGRSGVFLADPGNSRATFVPVEIGISGPELVEIVTPELSGLVVTLGQHLLEDGAAILIIGDDTAESGRKTPAVDKPETGGPGFTR